MDLDTNSSLNIEGLAAQFKDSITPREGNDIRGMAVTTCSAREPTK